MIFQKSAFDNMQTENLIAEQARRDIESIMHVNNFMPVSALSAAQMFRNEVLKKEVLESLGMQLRKDHRWEMLFLKDTERIACSFLEYTSSVQLKQLMDLLYENRDVIDIEKAADDFLKEGYRKMNDIRGVMHGMAYIAFVPFLQYIETTENEERKKELVIAMQQIYKKNYSSVKRFRPEDILDEATINCLYDTRDANEALIVFWFLFHHLNTLPLSSVLPAAYIRCQEMKWEMDQEKVRKYLKEFKDYDDGEEERNGFHIRMDSFLYHMGCNMKDLREPDEMEWSELAVSYLYKKDKLSKSRLKEPDRQQYIAAGKLCITLNRYYLDALVAAFRLWMHTPVKETAHNPDKENREKEKDIPAGKDLREMPADGKEAANRMVREENDELKKELSETLRQLDKERRKREHAEEKYCRLKEALKEKTDEENTVISEPQVIDASLRRILIVGGYPKWADKLKKQCSKWRFVSDDNIGGGRMPDLSRIELVIFFNRHMSHSLYDRIIARCRQTGVPYDYLTTTNPEKARSEIDRLAGKYLNKEPEQSQKN